MTIIKTFEELEQEGWSKQLVTLFEKDIAHQGDLTVGSILFQRFWHKSQSLMTPKERLEALLNHIDMPSDLVGSCEQNKELIDKFSINLEPNADFWHDFARLVSAVFPEDNLSQGGDLQRRVHQLRYIISSHQAQYVRYHFKKDGMTDQEALAHYLKDKRRANLFRDGDYSFKESARLHNKIALKKGRVIYPDKRPSANIKVLMGFHTEFILDSKGNFLNENDAEKVTESGVVNGASFNYGQSGKRHWQLDISPVRRHDPLFRKEMIRGFRAPNRSRKWPFGEKGDYDLSYFNPKGKYSLANKSSKKRVSREIKAFKRDMKNL